MDTDALDILPGPDHQPSLDYATAMHLISEHADPLAVCRSAVENQDQHDHEHDHEHDGPGTIRDHDRDSRFYVPEEIEAVLEECEANP